MQAQLLQIPRRSARRPRGWLAGFAGLAVAWLRHRAERRSLLSLGDRTLDDLGLTRADVEREYERPFWEPVDVAALEGARRRSGPRFGG